VPRVKRVPKQSTVQFIAMLRALDRAVASFGVSHAQVERRLCDWLAEGRRAEEALRGRPKADDGADDRPRLRALADRKTAVELSGLARMDGRRDRAGGQRIGELVAGRFPRGSMPSRRRVEVCVEVFLEILRENDPAGHADGMYGTQEAWREWWLQADQGHLPDIGDQALTVWGYLNVALEQLTATMTQDPIDLGDGGDGPAAGMAAGAEPPGIDSGAPGAEPGWARGDALDRVAADGVAADRVTADRVTAGRGGVGAAPAEDRVGVVYAERDAQLAAHRAEADLRVRQAQEAAAAEVAAAHAERDRALAHAERAAAEVRAAESEAAEVRRQMTGAHAERDEALHRARTAQLRFYRSSMVLVPAVIVAVGWSLLAGLRGSTHTVELAAPAQDITVTQQVRFAFVPPLPRGRDWTLNVKLNVTPTDLVSACTFNMRLTAHVQVDGQGLAAFTSSPGQTAITRTIHIGRRGNRGLQLVVTRLYTDPECRLRLDPAGSLATATG
jgi:hypothetical protein